MTTNSSNSWGTVHVTRELRYSGFLGEPEREWQWSTCCVQCVALCRLSPGSSIILLVNQSCTPASCTSRQRTSCVGCHTVNFRQLFEALQTRSCILISGQLSGRLCHTLGPSNSFCFASDKRQCVFNSPCSYHNALVSRQSNPYNCECMHNTGYISSPFVSRPTVWRGHSDACTHSTSQCLQPVQSALAFTTAARKRTHDTCRLHICSSWVWR